MKTYLKSRRMFLQGSGGAFLAIPFLNSLVPKSAQAQSNSGVTPKYIQLASSESGHRRHNSPTVAASLMLDADTSYQSIADLIAKSGKISANYGAALNAYASKINFISNLTVHARELLHNETAPTTGSGLARTAQNRSNGANPFSVDFRLEQNIYRNRTIPIKALRVNLDPVSSEGNTKYLTSFSTNGKGATPGTVLSIGALKNQVGLAFNNSQQPSEGPSPAAVARRDLLSAVFADYKKVINDRRISSLDKQLLDSALSNISQIQANESTAPSSGGGSCQMPPEASEINYFDRHKRAVDIIVAALSCGITDIVAYTINHGNDTYYSRPAIHEAHHAPGWDDSNVYMRWRVKVVTYFIERLSATIAASGKSLLDESLVYHGQEFADVSVPHAFEGYIAFLAGSAGGRLKTGMHLDAKGAPMGRALITIMKAFGLTTEQIEAGAEPGFGEYSTGTRLGDYPAALTAKYFQLAEKRKHFPILA